MAHASSAVHGALVSLDCSHRDLGSFPPPPIDFPDITLPGRPLQAVLPATLSLSDAMISPRATRGSFS
jgi:hypothetical protein